MATISDRSQRFDGSTRKLNLSFRNLAVNGGTNTRNYFPTLFTAPLELFHWVFNSKVNPPKILDALDGQIDGGTMLLVLGRPGSGCSTLLKTLAGHMVGLTIDPTSEVLYEGQCCAPPFTDNS
jgi:ATP-binding cassette subfamily G (WHITE) protein 2 (PDR)